ncbi:hypothetical protein DPMN_191584 [Dreissena polymorpha]|uniref:Uncharacterized protein n=1 Tax=Dreissena polymorpha TaxID=45954 RepID=A0A9D3Y5B2_DREPO|nr:hypothetical protein DPMN_191584 [Dreissena polymorpha]
MATQTTQSIEPGEIDLEKSKLSDSNQDCDSPDKTKRKYISSVSEHELSISESKAESKKQAKKKAKHEKQKAEGTKDTENMNIVDISKQLREINVKLSKVMLKDDSSLENMIETIVGKMKNSLLHRIELLEHKLFDKETENDNLKKDIDNLQKELVFEKEEKKQILLELTKEKESNKENLNDLEQYSRINNVVFHGLPDRDKAETPDVTI